MRMAVRGSKEACPGLVQRARSFGALALALIAAQSCGAPNPDISSADGRAQIMDAVDVALSTGDCTTAINLISPLYNSQYSDDDVRMKMASAYGCAAGINFFGLTGSLVTNSSELAGNGFWSLAAQLFPSKIGADYMMEGAFYATDALQSVLNSGALVLSENQINPNSFNVGSVLGSDRTVDSNLYLIYVAFAGIGAVESRYGNPNATYQKGNSLTWTSAAAMDDNGCGLAASILNFMDAFTQAQSELPASVGNSLNKVVSQGMGTLINQACVYGCNNTSPDTDTIENKAIYDPNGNWVTSGCNLASPCTTVCPTTLHSRTACTGETTDVNSCAAAGIINFINNSVGGWQ